MKLCRGNVVWVLAAASFVAMSSGLTLYIHLATVADSHHHDSDQCGVCQIIASATAGLHVEPQAAIVSTTDPVASIPQTDPVSPRWLTPIVLSPRPPPACMA